MASIFGICYIRSISLDKECLRPDFTLQSELSLISSCFILSSGAMQNFGVPNANSGTNFDVKSGLSVVDRPLVGPGVMIKTYINVCVQF